MGTFRFDSPHGQLTLSPYGKDLIAAEYQALSPPAWTGLRAVLVARRIDDRWVVSLSHLTLPDGTEPAITVEQQHLLIEAISPLIERWAQDHQRALLEAEYEYAGSRVATAMGIYTAAVQSVEQAKRTLDVARVRAAEMSEELARLLDKKPPDTSRTPGV